VRRVHDPDGRPQREVVHVFAVQADGAEIMTIEGLAKDGELHPVQEGLLGGARPAVRLLHARHDPVGVHLLNEIRRRAKSRFARPSRQLLPLHRLSAHRQRDSVRGEEDAGRDRARNREVTMTTKSPVLPKLVGSRVKRREDPRLIQGGATYVDDIKIVGCSTWRSSAAISHMGASARSTSSARRDMDGVEAVFTRAQIADLLLRCRSARRSDRPNIAPSPSTPSGIVGEPVAVVVASDRYIARDAARRDQRHLRHAARRRGSGRSDEGKAGARARGLPQQLSRWRVAERHRVRVRRARADDSAIDRHSPTPTSSSRSGCSISGSRRRDGAARRVAHYEQGKGTLTIWSSTPEPAHAADDDRDAMLGMGEDQVRAIAPEVGGGFGAKINIYGEEYVSRGVAKRSRCR
jgi:hypothetical protein